MHFYFLNSITHDFHLIGHHKHSIWDLDPSWDSKYLVTACADGYARLFEITTGNFLARMPHLG